MLKFNVQKALREFTFDAAAEIGPGVTVVVGPSGSGKTTLLRLIAGLLKPDSGSIVLDDRVLADAHTFVPPFRRNIGLVFQEYALFPHLTVAQNVGFGLRARGILKETRDARVARTLEQFEISSLAAARVTELSGGQRQRVALARALVVDPAALLLDEPLSALDPDTRTRVRTELAMLLRTVNVPALFVSHDESDRAAFGDHALHIERGVVTRLR